MDNEVSMAFDMGKEGKCELMGLNMKDIGGLIKPMEKGG